MIELEAKIMGFSLAAIVSQFGGISLAQVMPDGLDERQKRLDAMHDREVEAAAMSAQSREKLSTALDKLTEAVNKK